MAAGTEMQAVAAAAPATAAPPSLPPPPPSTAGTMQKLSRYHSLRAGALGDNTNAATAANARGRGVAATPVVASRYRSRSKSVAAADRQRLIPGAQLGGDDAPPPVPALPLSQMGQNVPVRVRGGDGAGIAGGWKFPARNGPLASSSVPSLQPSETVGGFENKVSAPHNVYGLHAHHSPAYHAAVEPLTAVLPGEEREERGRTRGLGRRVGSEGEGLRDQHQHQHQHQHQQHESATWADELARMQAETDRLLAEEKKRDLARLELQLAAATTAQQHHPVSAGLPASSPGAGASISSKQLGLKSPVLEKFSFLTRGRRSNTGTLSPTLSPQPCTTVDTSRISSLEQAPQPVAIAEPPPPAPIQLPQMDAPIASGASGDRHVQVRCKQLSIDVPVDADTTTDDVLSACSDALAYPLNTATSVVVETFTSLGLERRLRRYERIRDVLNSWDQDTQNSLLVLPSDASEGDRDLDLSSVPRTDEPPQGFVLQLYHSQRPGKWNKRFITLLETGQIVSSKKADFKLSDKDVQSLCHLTDFDIYKPTEAQMRRRLKPPKKHCFAIKSQQRPAIFVNTENFMHFFCTEDPNVAARFRAAVHGWRSWYLANRQIAVERGNKKKKKAENTGSNRPPPAPSAQAAASLQHRPSRSIGGHSRGSSSSQQPGPKASVDEKPYALGTFEPLLDMKRFDDSADEFSSGRTPSTPRHSRRTSAGPIVNDRSPTSPPASSSPQTRGRLRKARQPDTPAIGDDPVAATPTAATFAAKGLLGNGYDERKKAADAAANVRDDPNLFDASDGPFTQGPSLLNRVALEPAEPQKPEPASWFPSAQEHTAQVRSRSVHDSVRRQPSTSSAAPPLPATPSFPPQQQSQAHPLHREHTRRERGRPPPVSLPPQHQMPQPLVSFEPKFQEAPQWSAEGKGRGVRAPPGKHLVDLATGPASAASASGRFSTMDTIPPRSNTLLRRDTTTTVRSPSMTRQPRPLLMMNDPPAGAGSGGSAPRGRQRSASVAASIRRGEETSFSSSGGSGGVPPMPPSASRSFGLTAGGSGGRDIGGSGGGGGGGFDRERGRDPRPREFQSRGRTGTQR